MGNETSKSKPSRDELSHFKKYLHGTGIDIGGGIDALKIENGDVRIWDMPDGDAMIMNGVLDNTYDFVYSSHCLEHLRNINTSLANWSRIVKPGGFIYFTIPDYTLYEKDKWPSKFNLDHKFSFSTTIERKSVGRENHFHIDKDLRPILENLGIEIVEILLQDGGYDYKLPETIDQTSGYGALCQICVIGKKKV